MSNIRGQAPSWGQDRIDSEFHAIVADLAGTPTELVNPHTGKIDGRAIRTVWGQASWTGQASTPLAFAGQQVDAETSLHYNRYRYYDPATAGYTTPDPLGLAPNPASNTAYVHNPYTWIDPLGLKSCGTGDSPAGRDNFWTRKNDVNGKRVYQRDDLFDPHQVDERGRTNVERMQRGPAPEGADNRSPNLHHIGQRDDSAIAELTNTQHKGYYKQLHWNRGQFPSNIDRGAFRSWARGYWKAGVTDFL